MVKEFDEFVSVWKEQTKGVKIRKEYSHLLFLVVYPDEIEWDFSVEKQCQTTTLMVSGGPTGASTGHDVQFCYRSEVNDFLETCEHSHAMIVSVGMVFDTVGWTDDLSAKWRGGSINQVTPVTDFFDFVESGELVKGHILARPGKLSFFHYQHINLNVDMWKTLKCPDVYGRYKVIERSENNYHDDYTPHWAEIETWGRVQNFTHQERERKSFSYFREQDWSDFSGDEYYFSRFNTRIGEAFYIFNTEGLKKIPEGKFDLLFSPTAGYSAEVYANELDFEGTVVLYDYTQENLDTKRAIVDMNMSLEEIYMYRKSTGINMVDNTGNLPASIRSKSMGTHEEFRALQLKMNEEYDVQYWLMYLIEFDATRLINLVRNRNVFFDTSNIFSYHISHARYTLDELIWAYEGLHEILAYADRCWFQGTRPTKQWERKWISSLYE